VGVKGRRGEDDLLTFGVVVVARLTGRFRGRKVDAWWPMYVASAIIPAVAMSVRLLGDRGCVGNGFGRDKLPSSGVGSRLNFRIEGLW
jgi:hypothetical protein